MIPGFAGPIDVRPASDTSASISIETDGQAWDMFVRHHAAATVDHLWAWRGVIERVFAHETAYLAARREGAIVGVLPLVLMRSRIFGRSVISLPFLNDGGLLSDDAVARQMLLEAATVRARAFGAAHVELRHRARLCEGLPFRQHKLGMTLALPSAVDELWTSIDRKIRNQVRKAQKEGLETVTGGVELVDEFYAVFSENMRDLGTPVSPKRLFVETLEALPGSARVSVVRRGRQPMAAGLTVSLRNTVVNPWASSLRAYRSLCPNMLLYWTMLEMAVTGGATVFDFGRSSPGGGTHQFKLQWGAMETPLYWEYVLLRGTALPNQGPSNPKFERAIQLWQRLPLSVANVVGPYVARHLA